MKRIQINISEKKLCVKLITYQNYKLIIKCFFISCNFTIKSLL